MARQILRKHIEKNADPYTLAEHLHEAISSMLTKGERAASEQLFIGLPPLQYREEGELPARSLAKYSFLIFIRHGELYGDLRMSFGPNIVLLPITLGVLYAFVASKVTGRNKTLLQNGIIVASTPFLRHIARS